MGSLSILWRKSGEGCVMCPYCRDQDCETIIDYDDIDVDGFYARAKQEWSMF